MGGEGDLQPVHAIATSSDATEMESVPAQRGTELAQRFVQSLPATGQRVPEVGSGRRQPIGCNYPYRTTRLAFDSSLDQGSCSCGQPVAGSR